MRENRDDVEGWRPLGALLPQLVQVLREFELLGKALFFGPDNRIWRIDVGDDDLRPADQFAPILKRIIEQGRQHPRGEFDRDPIDPVEFLVARQAIQHLASALANEAFHLREVHRVDGGARFLALLVVLGRVHADKARPLHTLWRIFDRDAAELVGGREDAVVYLHLHDVFVFGDRPIGPVRALRRVMYRILSAQTLEVRVPGIRKIQLWVADIELVERLRVGGFARVVIDAGVHWITSQFGPQQALMLAFRHPYDEPIELLAHRDLAGEA